MADQDPIERLVRLAGTRPSASEERTARVRAQAHAEWTRVVSARTRRQRFATGAAVLALAAMVLLVVQYSTGRRARPPAPAPVVATLSAATGRVVFASRPLENNPADADLPVGGVVHASQGVRTNPGVLAALTLTNGVSLRADEGSRLVIDSPRDILLIEGRIYLDTDAHTDTSAPLRVRTPLGEVHDVGTRFEVRYGDGQLRVRVRDGQVIVNAGKDRARAGGGMEISSSANGLVTRASAPFGSEWGWVAKSAPPFVLAGRTLSEFLDWVSREAGYAVVFEGNAAAAASKTVLQGSINSLTPDEALEVVLPSTGLDYRVVEGRLIIRAR
jgi:ferric-dicitrate binding protein FerR (iron transport regulator)